MGEDVAGLEAVGLPASLVGAWATRYKVLRDIQLKAVNDYRVLEGDSLVVVAPTSSGKTFIGEMAAARAIIEGRKAVFLLPYRALVAEKYDQFDALYGQELGDAGNSLLWRLHRRHRAVPIRQVRPGRPHLRDVPLTGGIEPQLPCTDRVGCLG